MPNCHINFFFKQITISVVGRIPDIALFAN